MPKLLTDDWYEPIFLSWNDFDRHINIKNKFSVIGRYNVEKDRQYMFRRVRHDTDLKATYLFGKIRAKNGKLINEGELSIKILNRGQSKTLYYAWNGKTSIMNHASPIDWNKRLFFSPSKVRHPIIHSEDLLEYVIADPHEVIQICIDAPFQISLKTTEINLQIYRKIRE